MRRYQVRVGEKTFDITVAADGAEFAVTVDGRQRQVVVADLTSCRSQYLVDSLSREIDLRRHNGYWEVFLEGRQFAVETLDYNLAEIKKAAGVKETAKGPAEILAPMPGLVLNIFVEEGAQVERGETLLSLEAMKMENLIRASGPARIKKILVKPGEAIEKGARLIEFE